MRPSPLLSLIVTALAASTTACCGEARQRQVVTAERHEQEPEEEVHGPVLRGEASYYADFFAGRMDITSPGCYVSHVLYNWDFAQSCVAGS